MTILSSTSQSHAHYVLVTAADFTALKAGMEVKKKSCAGGDHQWVLKCGSGGDAPMDPMCDSTGHVRRRHDHVERLQVGPVLS